MNKVIKELEDDIVKFNYNLGVIKLRQLFDAIENENEVSKEDVERFLKVLSPFCPHIAEELWEKIGNKELISLNSWPEVDESKINDKFEQEEKAMEKTISDINHLMGIMKDKGTEFSKIFIYTIPPEVKNYDFEKLSERFGKEVQVFAVNDSKKYDPDGKAGKAKPGRPAIYFE